MAKLKTSVIKSILSHPDKDEIISKSIIQVPSKDITEWLKGKYSDINEKQFIISEKDIKKFQDEYLDIYTTIREDIMIVKNSQIDPAQELSESIQNNPKYHDSLNAYIDKEVDIKTIVKKMVVAIEYRASQVFDTIQDDPENIKIDRTLIEWFNTLITVLEKYDTILNGNPDQVNIQNNINIQILDKHIGVIYNLIKDILAKLDYDSSLEFIDKFQEAMQKLESTTNEALPVDFRLNEAKILQEDMKSKIQN